MTIKFSTGLRNKMLDTGSFKATMALGFLKLYTGAEPASPDDAATGTLLCTISVASGATGLSMAASAVSGSLAKAAEVWSGVNAASGTVGYWRFVAAGDTGASSTTQARVQGSVGTSGADLNLSNLSLTSGATQTIDYASFTLPVS